MVNITQNFHLVLILLDPQGPQDTEACSVLTALPWVSKILHFPGSPTFSPSALSQSPLFSLFVVVVILLNAGILHCLVLSFILPPGRCMIWFLFLEHTPPPPSPLPLVTVTHLPGCILEFTSSRKSSLTFLPHLNNLRYLL